jgi:CDP-diacylglycerol---serine O-phosphatidyltransferase
MNRNNIIVRMFPAFEYYNIANLMTTLTIVLNIIIVYLLLQGNSKWAIGLFAFVAILDVFDGKVARWTNSTSEFGARLDSLCDAVSFSFMPAVIAFFLGFDTPAAIVLVIINAIAGMWRLAYFDLFGMVKEDGREFYIGTPTTRSASLFFIGLAILGFYKEYIPLFFYIFFIVSPIIMLMNVKIEKMGLFAKFLYVVFPISMILFLFSW